MSPCSSLLSQAEVLDRLRDFLTRRRSAYGLHALGCFGSVARAEATPESDVDIVYHLNSSACLTLIDLALLQQELMELLGTSVDLIEWRETLPQRFRDRLKQEVIYA